MAARSSRPVQPSNRPTQPLRAAGGTSSAPPRIITPRPPSGRPNSGAPARRKRLRKDDIVFEATKLFAERGYEGASMGDLAQRVGLRKASLFHHFPSKEALYATVLEQLLGRVKDAILAAALSPGSFQERLDALTDAITTTLGEHPHAARLLIRESMDWGPLMSDRLAPVLGDVMAAALEFGKAGQEAGVFDQEIDMKHAIISMVGVHFMPFAIGEVVERFSGSSPFQSSFVADRCKAVRDQSLRMFVSKKRGA